MSLDKHRLHLSSQTLKKTDLKNLSNVSRVSRKPRGVWFACGTEWMEWVVTTGMLSAEPIDWIRWGISRNNWYLYHFEIDMSRILQIETPSQFEEFQRQYGEYITYEPHPLLTNSMSSYHAIRWHEVEANYAGIQICPYMYKVLEDFEKKDFRFQSQDEQNSFRLWQAFYSKSSWYHGWDVASGCIWDTSVISDVILVGTKKDINSKFETWPVMKKVENLQRNRKIDPVHDIPDAYI